MTSSYVILVYFLCLYIISFLEQGRQKLALFNAKEFATLIVDILNDARRREQDSNPDLTQGMAMLLS